MDSFGWHMTRRYDNVYRGSRPTLGFHEDNQYRNDDRPVSYIEMEPDYDESWDDSAEHVHNVLTMPVRGRNRTETLAPDDVSGEIPEAPVRMLSVPGSTVDFDFENRLVSGSPVSSTEVSILEEGNNLGTAKRKRSFFRRNKTGSEKLLQKINTANKNLPDYTYENHIALEGVENGYPAIIVSEVIDPADDNQVAPGDNICVDEETLVQDGTVHRPHKPRHRPKPRKFSVASALTDISYRSEVSSSSKVSTLLDVDWEADEELRESLTEMLQQRKGRKKRRKKSSASSRSSESDIPEEERETDLTKLYNNDEEDEERIFENIKLQKEIMESLRTQAWPMKRKLKTLKLTKSYVERYEGQLSRGHGYQEASAKYWKRVKREFINFLSFFIPWEMRIKLIESYFGSVVASYFVFLRWMFWVNIVMTVLNVCLLAVPEIMVGDPFGSTIDKTIPLDERDRALNFDTMMDFGGYLQYSILFYGYYGNKKKIGGVYRLPLAYLLVGLSGFGVSFLIILRKLAANSRMSKVTSKEEQYTFSWKSFTSWDFMIGNPETAKNKVAEITIVLRESIEEERERTKKATTKTLIFLRVLANIMVLIVLVSSTYAINLVVGRSQEVEKKLDRGEPVGWWEQNEVSFVMSFITALYPSLFDLINMMEKYHPRINLRLQLGRILVLYLLNLYTLMFALYWKIIDKNNAVSQLLNGTLCGVTPSGLESVTSQTIMASTENFNCSGQAASSASKRICWETMLGQEISKLTMFDLIITVATIIMIDFVRGLAVRYLSRYWCWDLETKFPEYGEFKIAENLLHTTYNQAMVWMGSFFAPLLPALNIIKLIILLYTRSWAVIVCNIPHARVFRASRSNNFYFALLLLMLFLVTLPVAFLLVQLTPSPDCGPFRGYQRSYHVLTKTIEEELPAWVNTVLEYVASPGVIMPLLLLLVLTIYYLLSLNASLKEANSDLRNQLQYERTEERKNVFAMAEAVKERAAGTEDKPQAPPSETPMVKPMVNNVVKTTMSDPEKGDPELNEEMDKPSENMDTGTRILRIPGMSLDQASLIQSKHPGVRVMSRDEAIRLNIIPPPPPPPPEPDSDPEHEAEMEPEREDGLDTNLDIGDTSARDRPTHVDQNQHVVTIPMQTLNESAVPTLPQSRRTRPLGVAATPPVAVVQGKPMQGNRPRLSERRESSFDDAVLF